jgi:quercetin dioxygenase-like cupin family protein
MSNLQDLESVGPKPIWEGVTARMVEGDRITMAVVELAPGGEVPEHRHEHEQIGMVIQGRVTFTVGEETGELGPGGTWRIPSDTPHQVAVGEEGAVVIDIFSPPRTDWQQIDPEAVRRPLWPPNL